MNTKQTATEWLFEKLWDSPKDKLTWNAILEKANKMFEQQIIDACNQNEFEDEDNFGIADNITKGEQYYKEQYDK
jgi:hypothetical protein